jgi:integrase/recombinase XerD
MSVELQPRALMSLLTPVLAERILQYVAETVANLNTRDAYWRAMKRFLEWAPTHGVASIEEVGQGHVEVYVEELKRSLSPLSVRMHLTALRRVFGCLVANKVIAANPVQGVENPKVVEPVGGKTVGLTEAEARGLVNSVVGDEICDLRDRAIIGVLLYTSARASAVAGLKVGDYQKTGARAWFRIDESRGRIVHVPAHPQAVKLLDQYLAALGDRVGGPDEPLFRSRWSDRGQIQRADIYRMVKRRAANAGINVAISPHSFRVAGATAFLGNAELASSAPVASARPMARAARSPIERARP